MSIGIIVKNLNSEIQIDGEYRNHAKHEEGNNVTISNSADAFSTLIDIIDSNLAPLILFQPNTDYFCCLSSLVRSINLFTAFRMVTEGLQSTTINWKSYREVPSKSSDNYGLRIYTRNQNLIFDSGKSYFRIHAVASISLSNPSYGSDPYYDYSHPNVSNPFYIVSAQGYWFSGVYGPPPFPSVWRRKIIGIKQLTATSLRIGWFMFRSGSAAPGLPSIEEGFNPSPFKLIVCEV